MFSLYIGNLPEQTYDLDLYNFFKSNNFYLSSAKVMFNRQNKKSQGYGYVNFHTHEEAERCINELNNAKFGNKQIQLNWKKDKNFDSKANIYVRNLPNEVD